MQITPINYKLIQKVWIFASVRKNPHFFWQIAV